ncbi:MAG: CYTH domain-containing protein [Burkholderiales bacterium]|nr:CYTH domain-containing protein [Burkholderiales bacterium]
MHEIELKFQIPPEARAAVRSGVATPGAQTTRLRAFYVDTPELHLARAGMALRLRQEGERWVQTFKAPGGDALRRIEHEVQLDAAAVAAGPRLDLARHAGNPAGAALAGALGDGAAALRVTFETDVSRCHRVMRHAGADIELALDVGVVRAGESELALREIEFELVDGPVAGLLDLARHWVEQHGLWLDVRSKAERGHLLAHRMTVASATLARPVRAADTRDADLALRRTVEASLDHILPNAAALAAGLASDDHLTQARLGVAALHQAFTSLPNQGQARALTGARTQADAEKSWMRRLGELTVQLDSSKHQSGAALRSATAGALWLELLGYALADQAR